MHRCMYGQCTLLIIPPAAFSFTRVYGCMKNFKPFLYFMFRDADILLHLPHTLKKKSAVRTRRYEEMNLFKSCQVREGTQMSTLSHFYRSSIPDVNHRGGSDIQSIFGKIYNNSDS